MNATNNAERMTLMQAAQHRLQEETKRSQALLEKRADDVEKFQWLVDQLRQKGLRFTARVDATHFAILYSMKVDHKHAGELMMALANLGCDEITQRSCLTTHGTNIEISSPAGPDFMLHIEPIQQPANEVRHADAIAA